ncbi:MAG: hypothetical protein IJQ35_00845 [Bacteroidales bacterium]|nr:hypothetical protein [Bacteroidales bacterium]
MRKIAFLAAVAATLCTVACNKNSEILRSAQNDNNVQAGNEAQLCELRVGIKGAWETKSTTITAADEVKVNNLQVLVFRGDALDAYGSVDDASEITLSCTAGEREVYAVVNAPSLAEISTKTALLATTSLLSQNSGDSFQMIGNKEVTLPQANTITVDVTRMAARIVIKKITRAFTVSSLAAKTFTVDEIFITNVAGDINFGKTASPAVWFNKQAYASEQSAFTHDAPAAAIVNGAYNDTAHSFYAYPNAADDSSGAIWSPRRTRLVLKTTLGTDIYYYPITLPVLEPNKNYEIENLTLTRPGSNDPDQPVSFQDATFEISVQPWTVVPVTDGITI